MPDSPAHAEHRRRAYPRLLTDECADGNHVIHLERMSRAEGNGRHVCSESFAH